MTRLSSEATVTGLRDDQKIYIEATIAHKQISQGWPEVMLITDDHQFFNMFARSPVAENILSSQVEAVRGETRQPSSQSPPLRIKLAGEVVPGM